MTKLSICIPTYNRSALLQELLNSIVCQVTEDIEIVISDNASEDDTQKVVQQYQKQFPYIKYYRSDKNEGFDANFMKVCSLAQGEFCWCIGSDDMLEEGAINFVITTLQNNKNLNGMTLGCYVYDKTLSYRIEKNNLLPNMPSEIFLDGNKCFEKMGPLFTYISTHIFRRKLFLKYIPKDSSRYFAYIHLYLLSQIVKNNCPWGYYNNPYVGNRSANTTFVQDQGFLKWLTIETSAYHNVLYDTFDSDRKISRSFNNKIFKPFIRWRIIVPKLSNQPLSFFYHALRICLKYFKYDVRFWVWIFPLFLAPGFVFKGIKKIKNLVLTKKTI
jgi:abequosyltransferase